MQNFHIAMIAAGAGMLAASRGVDRRDLAPEHERQAAQLYAYCRERKFPPAEQLARKDAQNGGHRFDPDQWQASEPLRASYEVFRAVALALDPLWEPDAAPADDAALAQGEAAGAAADEAAQDKATKDTSTKEDETMNKPEPAKDQDTVAARTETGQAAMDAAIAEATGTPAAPDGSKDSDGVPGGEEPADDKPKGKAKSGK